MEVQAFSGNNVKGVNTGLAAFGKTFGVQAVTTGEAGGIAQPAALFADLDNSATTTQGNAIRAYTDDATSASLVSFYQESSAYTGTGLIMNFGNGGGSANFSGRFIDLQKAGTSKFLIDSMGQVAVGTTSIGSMFDIASSTTVANVDLFRIVSNNTSTGNVVFRVDSDGSVFSDGGTAMGTPADVAENYPVLEEGLEAGDVVSFSTTTVALYNTEYNLEHKLVGGLVKTSSVNPNTIGIVSTEPGVLLSSLTASSVPVALAGRVPVKVTNENGPINPGDYLAPSSQFPGYAAKAKYSGQVIGQAMESFNGDPLVLVTSGPSAGSILVFVKVAWQNVNNTFVLEDTQITGGVGGGATSSVATSFLINQNGSGNILQLQSQGQDRFLVASSGAVSILANTTSTTENLLTVINASTTLFSINSVGELTTTGHITVGKDTAGTATIKAGDNQTTVTFDIPYTSVPKVIATVNGVPNFFYGLIEKTENGFTIAADRAVTQDMTFDWVALNQPENTESQSGINLQVISAPISASESGGTTLGVTVTTTPTPAPAPAPAPEEAPSPELSEGESVTPEPEPVTTSPTPEPASAPEPAAAEPISEPAATAPEPAPTSQAESSVAIP